MSDTLRSLFSGNSFRHGASGAGVGSPIPLPLSHQQVTPDVTPNAIIRVFGLGGAGSNAVKRMVEGKVQGVEFVAVNTDGQALYHNPAQRKIHIGRGTTRGLGAGSNPDVGKKAAEESSEEIKAVLEGADMVFLTAGLGGGTGGGSIPLIAEMARSMGILTVAVVTRPFSFEGLRRRKQAEEAFENLRTKVDTLITIPNDKILSLIDKTTPLVEAFAIVDEVLRHGIEGIASLVTVHGLVNVDFADVKTIMQDAGSALMGIGYGAGDSRAAEAARAAIDSPLLELSISGAKGILFNITGGNDLSMFEVDEAARIITESADPEAHVIFGAVIDEQFTGQVKCTVIATGFAEQQISASPPGSTAAFRGGRAAPADARRDQAVALTARTPMISEEELDVPAFIRKRLTK